MGYTTTMGCIHHTIHGRVTHPFLQTIRPLVHRAAPTPLAIASTTWPLHTTHMTVRDIMMGSRPYIPLLDCLWRISMTTDLYLRFSWQPLLLNRSSTSDIQSQRMWMGTGCTNDTRRPTLRFTLWPNRHCSLNSPMAPNQRSCTTTITTPTSAKVSHRVHQTSLFGPNLRSRLGQDHVQLKDHRGVDSQPQAKSNRVAFSTPCASSHCPTGPRGSTRKSRHLANTRTVVRQRRRACTLLVLHRCLGWGMVIINSHVLWRTRLIICLVGILQTPTGHDWMDRWFLVVQMFDGRSICFVVYRPFAIVLWFHWMNVVEEERAEIWRKN